MLVFIRPDAVYSCMKALEFKFCCMDKRTVRLVEIHKQEF